MLENCVRSIDTDQNLSPISQKGAKNLVSMKNYENSLRHLRNVVVRKKNNDHCFVNDKQQVKIVY